MEEERCSNIGFDKQPQKFYSWCDMNTAKLDVKSIIDRLPDDATLEQIEYEIYVLRAIREGLDDLKNGRTHTQEEVEAMVREWTSL